MKRGSKNKNFKENIKSWLIALGFCLGLMLMGAESEDLSTIWVNFLGIGLLVGSAWLGGAFEKLRKEV